MCYANGMHHLANWQDIQRGETDEIKFGIFFSFSSSSSSSNK